MRGSRSRSRASYIGVLDGEILKSLNMNNGDVFALLHKRNPAWHHHGWRNSQATSSAGANMYPDEQLFTHFNPIGKV